LFSRRPDKGITLQAHSLELEHPTLGTRLALDAPPSVTEALEFSALRGVGGGG